jgi:hypothetical protein
VKRDVTGPRSLQTGVLMPTGELVDLAILMRKLDVDQSGDRTRPLTYRDYNRAHCLLDLARRGKLDEALMMSSQFAVRVSCCGEYMTRAEVAKHDAVLCLMRGAPSTAPAPGA